MRDFSIFDDLFRDQKSIPAYSKKYKMYMYVLHAIIEVEQIMQMIPVKLH